MSVVSLEQMVTELAHGPTLVSFPTDTVPGLATRPEHANLIFEAKRRPPEKPLILMGASFADLRPYIEANEDIEANEEASESELAIWQQVTEQYWPGQLTLVLPMSSLTPQNLNPA